MTMPPRVNFGPMRGIRIVMNRPANKIMAHSILFAMGGYFR